MDSQIKPLISVIIPVYNGEQWIRRCMDSLVYQTLENIEVIAVSNGSTDGTWDILQEYERLYPQKVVVRQIEHTNGPGSGRNVGLSLSKADYIGFADADDYFEYDAMEQLYNKMIEADYDIVYCANYDVRNGKLKKARTLQSTDKKFVQRYGSMVYWNKLFKKELFQIAGKIPEDIVFEDIAYVSTLISLSQKIGYIDKPLYYYIIRDDSGVNDLKSDRILHELKANDIAISNCDQSVKDELLATILYRSYYDLTKARWTYADKFIEYLKERRDLFHIDAIFKESKLCDILERIDSLGSKKIPDIVYYNDFEEVSAEYQQNLENSLRENCELIGLNEKNCNVYSNEKTKQWYEEQDFQNLSAYFALEKISQTGGFFISSRVEMINTFNCFKYCESIWGFEEKCQFTDEIFGAVEGSEAVRQVLEIAKNMDGMSVKDSIKYVMIIRYKMKLNGKTQINQDRVTLLDPTILITDLTGDYHVSKLHYVDCNSEYEVVRKATLDCIK